MLLEYWQQNCIQVLFYSQDFLERKYTSNIASLARVWPFDVPFQKVFANWLESF